MKIKAYKPAVIRIALLACAAPILAQDTAATAGRSDREFNDEKTDRLIDLNLNVNLKHLDLAMEKLDKTLNKSLGKLNMDIHSLVATGITSAVSSINVDVNAAIDDGMDQSGNVSERVKNYTKTYSLDANDKLRIDNKFGKVVVNTWNRNEVKVDVEMRAYADNDNTAQKMIDAISISDDKSGDVVSFSTNYGNRSGGSIWDLFNNRNDHHKAEVNYTIYMPSKNALAINNRYGATELPDFDGRVEIDCAYGSFSAKSLPHADNQIKMRYGSAEIDGLSSADVSVGYGSLDIGSVDKLNCELRYTGDVRIGKLRNSGNINAHYAGKIYIDNLDKNFSSFSYSSSYSGLKIGIDNSTNANFDITVRYGDFNYGSAPVEITEKTPSDDSKGWKPTKNFKGHIGKGSSDKMINISSSYGGVKFD